MNSFSPPHPRRYRDLPPETGRIEVGLPQLRDWGLYVLYKECAAYGEIRSYHGNVPDSHGYTSSVEWISPHGSASLISSYSLEQAFKNMISHIKNSLYALCLDIKNNQ